MGGGELFGSADGPPDPAAMAEPSSPLSAEETVMVATTVLAQHPESLIAGLDRAGAGLEIPESLKAFGCTEVSGSIIGIIPSTDVAEAVNTFQRARAVGAARCKVHLLTDNERPAEYRVFNLVETHGLFLRVIVPLGHTPESDVPEGVIDTVFKPRFCTVIKDETAVISGIDSAFSALFGFEAADCVGERSLTFIHPDDHQLAVEAWLHMLSRSHQPRPVKLRHRHADGHWIWVEVVNYNRLDEAGVVRADMADITDQMAAQEALVERERLLHGLAEALPLGVVQLNPDMELTYANEFLRHLLETEQLTCLDDLAAHVAADERRAFCALFASALTHGVGGESEIHLIEPQPRICSLSLRTIENSDGRVTAIIACLSDITEKAQLEQKLRYQATYDPLTGCSNRASTLHTLEAALTDEAGVGVVFADLDRFKPVNDKHGHAVGDELLVAVAERFRQALRESDTVGRIGGDEFLLLVPGIESDAEAGALRERVAGAFATPLELSIGPVEVDVSLGIAWTAESGVSADELVARADEAMYRSKADQTTSVARRTRH